LAENNNAREAASEAVDSLFREGYREQDSNDDSISLTEKGLQEPDHAMKPMERWHTV